MIRFACRSREGLTRKATQGFASLRVPHAQSDALAEVREREPRRTVRFLSPHLCQSIDPVVLPLVQPHPLTASPPDTLRSGDSRRWQGGAAGTGGMRCCRWRRVPPGSRFLGCASPWPGSILGGKWDLNLTREDFSTHPATEDGSGLRRG